MIIYFLNLKWNIPYLLTWKNQEEEDQDEDQNQIEALIQFQIRVIR